MNMEIRARCVVDSDTMASQAQRSPDLPEPSGEGRLAVVGGGPSVLPFVDELRGYDGNVWAVNGIFGWCVENDIKARFFSVDGQPIVGTLINGGPAILAEHCHPSAFEAAGECWKISHPMPGPTSPVAACVWGLKAGYEHVTVYGCESSYAGKSHVYQHETPRDLVEVDCGGELFLTKLEMILQVQQLGSIIRAFPEMYAERSGGLLSAYVRHGDCDVTRVSRAIQITTEPRAQGATQ